MLVRQLLDRLSESSTFQPVDVIGDANKVVLGLGEVRSASVVELAFVDEVYYAKHPDIINQTRAGCVIIPRKVVPELSPTTIVRTFIVTAHPRLLFAYLGRFFDAPTYGISEHARIGPDVEMGLGCTVEAGAVIDHATVGNNVRIGSNVVIGGPGFGYCTDAVTGRVVRMPQVKRVVIGDNVEILANAAIARGALKDTIIEDDVKIDHLVHVAHGCRIGQGTLVIAGAMLAGSTDIGRYCWIAPGTQVINGATVGDFALTGMGAVVIEDVAPNSVVVGVPARKIRDRFEPGDPILSL